MLWCPEICNGKWCQGLRGTVTTVKPVISCTLFLTPDLCYDVEPKVSDSKQVIVSGKLRAQRAKSMKFKDGYMISSGQPVKEYIDSAVRHVLLRQVSFYHHHDSVLCLKFFHGWVFIYIFRDSVFSDDSRVFLVSKGRSC